ncbi:DUF1835 domain-containing protein [Bacillus salipaludis]|uniref:DUF1835 domain-containing protein n=1 Tax=Bacillus salipaludis TaxID=2547811 RepID=A0A4R5VQA7_9BACI|nr:DUF1835 domain-containing protein [Bacillus salipaludis]TDK60747.1 DUF1835 domain-containing protein [Bacillus salipaludis]
MIHIVNGDVVGNKIKQIEGDILVWREMYDFGPLNLTWSKEEQIKKRAHFFEEKLEIPSEFFIQNCQNQDRILNGIAKSEEVILWFEHDRFDQTMLMYLLTELSTKGCENISLISIDQYPGITPFYGLGQLSSGQLLGLLDSRKKITTEQIHEATTGWTAYNSTENEDIEKWILSKNHTLPFLLRVLQDHKSYFPSIQTGLNEVEYLALSFLREDGCLFYDLCSHIMEERINDGLSNLHLAAILKELMKGPYPLLKGNIPLPNYSHPASNPMLELTSYGLDVLNGAQNRIELVGIDWWVGGVYLHT